MLVDQRELRQSQPSILTISDIPEYSDRQAFVR